MNWCPRNGGPGLSRVYLRLSGIGSPGFFLCLGMILRLPLTRFRVISQGCIVSGEPQPQLRHYFFSSFKFCCILPSPPLIPLLLVLHSKRQPKLKSRYKKRVEKAIEYVRTIENWDDLMDPRTLAFYCLELEPSVFICTLLKLKEKRVSVRFVSTDFLIYTCFLFFLFFTSVFLLQK